MDTEMEYYLGISPDKLNDRQWAEKWQQLMDIRKRESDGNLHFQ